MRIGEVAEQSGSSTSAIRYYESVGVLPEPERVGRPATLRAGACSGS